MPTYTPVQSIVLTEAVSSVTFSNISQNYQDLRIVVSGMTSNVNEVQLQYNGDTSALYSRRYLEANGSSLSTAVNAGGTSHLAIWSQGVTGQSATYDLIGYSNTNTFKAMLFNMNTNALSIRQVCLYRSTSAITSLKYFVSSGTMPAGTTFDIYGISPAAANTAQAFGGTDIFYDSTYVYHVFKGTGTFTPYRSLSCDYLVVAGGGSGGNNIGGGGGAGGFRIATSQSLTATNYAVVVGGGGGNSSSGTASTFNALATTGGGAGGGANVNGSAGGSGGGGGGATTGTGGAGNSGSYTPVEGYAGGNGNRGSGANRSGGGGGAGAVGQNFQTTASGAGGVGAGGVSYTNYEIINAMAVATGTGVLSSGNYYYAGGGGGGNQGTNINGVGGTGGGGAGGNNANGTSGTTNTGSGGGGGGNDLSNGFSGGNGGSGIVIVRYAR